MTIDRFRGDQLAHYINNHALVPFYRNLKELQEKNGSFFLAVPLIIGTDTLLTLSQKISDAVELILKGFFNITSEGKLNFAIYGAQQITAGIVLLIAFPLRTLYRTIWVSMAMLHSSSETISREYEKKSSYPASSFTMTEEELECWNQDRLSVASE